MKKNSVDRAYLISLKQEIDCDIMWLECIIRLGESNSNVRLASRT